MRYRLSFLLICAAVLSVQCQIPDTNIEAYREAKSGLVVLNDSEKLLPLGGLDTLRPSLLSIGLADDTELYNTLNTYVPTSRIDWQSNVAADNGIFGASPKATNLLIVAMDAHGLEASGFPFQLFFMPKAFPVILLWFGRNELTKALATPKFGTVLFSETNTAWAQSLSAQILFGAVGADATLKEGIGESFPLGSGLRVQSCQRLAFAPPASVGMNEKLLQDSIAAIIEEGLRHQAFPGAQVLVAKNDVVVYHEAFGYHTDQAERMVQRTDIYDLASVTKITSALPALIKWYGEGTLDLDAPLVSYYPAAKGTNKADLDFRAMLSHQARLRPWIPYWQGTLRGNGKYPWSRARDPERTNDYRFRRRSLARDSSDKYPLFLTETLWQHRDYREKMMKAILKSPLEEEAVYKYSGLLFYLLPDIVSLKTGVDYEDYLNETFYRPLGAYTLGFNPSRFFDKSQIIPTERDTFFRKQLLHGYVHDEGAAMMGGLSANAGLFANACDLAKIMQMYLNGGTFGGERYLSTAALDTFTHRHYPENGNRRGLGFDKPLLEYDAAQSSVAAAASPASFGHAGYTGTFTWADPENGLLFVFMSNRVYPNRLNRGLYTRSIRPRLHTVLYEAIDQKNKKQP